MSITSLLPDALRLLAGGTPIVPIDSTSKRALVRWKVYQTTLPPAELVERWLRRHGERKGLAIVTGSVSRREALDFDKEPQQTFDRWCERVEARRPGLVARLAGERTRRGGIHLHYACETVEASQVLALRPHADDPERAEVLIETRGTGSLCAVAPTSGYEVFQGNIANPPTITPEERAILLEEARALNRWTRPERVRPQTSTEGQTLPPTGSVVGERPGDDFNARADNQTVLALLLQEGWTLAGDHGSYLSLTKPGSDPAHGGHATLGYIAPGVLYVFSTAAAPFEAGDAYKPFAIYTQLRHGGDYAAAARDLGEQGYGVRRPALRVLRDAENGQQNVPQEGGGCARCVQLEAEIAVLRAELAEYRERERQEEELFARTDLNGGEKLTLRALAPVLATVNRYEATPRPDGGIKVTPGPIALRAGLKSTATVARALKVGARAGLWQLDYETAVNSKGQEFPVTILKPAERPKSTAEQLAVFAQMPTPIREREGTNGKTETYAGRAWGGKRTCPHCGESANFCTQRTETVRVTCGECGHDIGEATVAHPVETVPAEELPAEVEQIVAAAWARLDLQDQTDNGQQNVPQESTSRELGNDSAARRRSVLDGLGQQDRSRSAPLPRRRSARPACWGCGDRFEASELRVKAGPDGDESYCVACWAEMFPPSRTQIAFDLATGGGG